MALMIQNIDLEKENNEQGECIVDGNGIKHLFEKSDLIAAWAAHQAGRPLLLRGKPGTGKSQFAKAIAHLLGWAFVADIMHGGKELEELHYQYDAINRLGEAQSLAYRKKGKGLDEEGNVDAILAHKNFIRPGPFWWAFAWKSALDCLPDNAEAKNMVPSHPEKGWDEKKDGVVLLIDEIDKAEPDLPNGLLHTIGDLEFTVPYVNQRIKADPRRLLMIITTNEERELPSALIRRCFSHTLRMEEKERDDARITWLVKRGRLHFPEAIHSKVYREAADLLWRDRKSHKRYPPGLAEYLDLLRTLATIDKSQQEQRVKEISQYVYDKETEK